MSGIVRHTIANRGRGCVTDVLKARLILEMGRNHGMIWVRRWDIFRARRSLVFLIIVVGITLASKIFRAFMFMRRAKVLIPAQSFSDITGGELIKLLVMTENDYGNIYRAEDGELMSFLE
jgi:hypothetical protein